MALTRRDVLHGTAVLAAAQASAQRGQASSSAGSKPNIVFIVSDQFRADALGCMRMNPMNMTPNLDALAARGVLFRQAMTNQPVCAPARASMLTGQYPATHGVWKNSLGLKPDAVTLPSVLRDNGYTANFIGKWHLSAQTPTDKMSGAVPLANRGGFNDFWEGANALELTSHAFEGDMWDGDGKPLHFENEYRADFVTERTVRFLREKRDKSKPFLLMVSYLEVHHQNDTDTYVPPVKYANKYPNPFVPQDLRPLPGAWPSQLTGYYGCVAAVDDAIGTLMSTLKEQGLGENTIVVFTSDHGCHFKTRNGEYKRSPHESSIHVPLIVQGPGFNTPLEVPQLVSHVDLMPTLLEAAGIPIPRTVQGRSALPLVAGRTEGWRDEVFIEISESLTGRALRTPQWTYAVAVPGTQQSNAAQYSEYILYDRFADPYQHVNLAGRNETKEISKQLRERLIARIEEAGDPRPAINPPYISYV